MSVKVVMPEVGESVTTGYISEWLKQPGDEVAVDEALVSIETDKATVDVPSPVSGTVKKILHEVNAEVEIGAVLAEIEEGEISKSAPSAPAPAAESAPQPAAPSPAAPSAPAASRPTADELAPAVRRVVAERGLDPSTISGSGRGGRITKGDALAAPAPQAQAPAPAAKAPTPPPPPVRVPTGERTDEVVPMTPIRRRIAERLLQAQHDAALLTTFNEADMSRVMALRSQFQDSFVKKHGIKLGFMSFFVKAAVEALKAYPVVNAQIEGTNIVYRNYIDIGVAVGGGRGLVVPIIRNADQLSFADIELTIADFGARARDNKIKLDEMQGGTFTISNGGIYGSLLSTPIINPPQSGILGMHAIQKRPVAVGDEVKIRPMMYLALSYDHRLVDGREAVSFLVRLKECIENPERILFDI